MYYKLACWHDKSFMTKPFISLCFSKTAHSLSTMLQITWKGYIILGSLEILFPLFLTMQFIVVTFQDICNEWDVDQLFSPNKAFISKEILWNIFW